MLDQPALCPRCGAAVLSAAVHASWHSDRGDLGTYWTMLALEDAIEHPSGRRPADEAPTAKLPPIGATIRRRPPVPATARELKGAELLRALADAIDDDEDLADDERRPCLHCGHTPALHSDDGFCTYPGCECAVYE